MRQQRSLSKGSMDTSQPSKSKVEWHSSAPSTSQLFSHTRVTFKHSCGSQPYCLHGKRDEKVISKGRRFKSRRMLSANGGQFHAHTNGGPKPKRGWLVVGNRMLLPRTAESKVSEAEQCRWTSWIDGWTSSRKQLRLVCSQPAVIFISWASNTRPKLPLKMYPDKYATTHRISDSKKIKVFYTNVRYVMPTKTQWSSVPGLVT